MATKVDPSSPVEPRRGQSTTSSSLPANSPKVSIFGAKSGFVIPKNKLSGSLVPIFRGGSKVDTSNNVKEDSSKQVRRKTKWGDDLTQDAAVRKGRALAYQTRVEQITQQLKPGVLEIEDDQGFQSPKQDSDQPSATNYIDKKAMKFELLELEKREIIGEILRLNPSYKAPPDYKPLLKEGNVPIPVKAYPGYNFIGLLLGPENNTQKRLEEETGAKIRVYGTKANTKEKREITQSDMNEAHAAYAELYVNVAADTYEKVDAAISLIELLVTPVSGNANPTSVAIDNSNTHHQTQKDPSDHGITMTTDVNQVMPQPMLISATASQLHLQQRFSSPWFPTGPPSAPLRPATGFSPLPTPNSHVQFSPHGGPQYLHPTSFGPAPRTTSPLGWRPQFPLQAVQQPRPNQAQNQAMPGQQRPQVYPVMSTQHRPNPPAPFPTFRPMLIRPMPASRPSAPMSQQPGPMARPLVRTQTPGDSSPWSSAHPVGPPFPRPTMMQMTQPLNPPVRSQQASLPPQPSMPNNIARPLQGNFDPYMFPKQPTIPASFTPVPRQIRPLSIPPAVSSSGAPLQAPIPPPTSIPSTIPSTAPRPPMASQLPAPSSQTHVSQAVHSMGASASSGAQAMAPSQVMTRPPGSLPSVAPGLVQPRPHTPQRPPAAGSTSGNMPSFPPTKPQAVSSTGVQSVPAPKPMRPSSGDFTFQPIRANVPESPITPRPNVPSIAQNITTAPLAALQAPSFRPAIQIPTTTMGTPSVPLSSGVNQQRPIQLPIHQSPASTHFPTNSTQAPIIPAPTPTRPPPRFPHPSSNFVTPMSQSIQTAPSRPLLQAPQMGPASFSPALRAQTLASAIPVRPPNILHQLPPANRPGGLMIPNQQLPRNQLGVASGQMPSASGGNQFYDPFSPTSISSAPSQQAGNHQKVQKQEPDAEYEDLMASVGVK